MGMGCSFGAQVHAFLPYHCALHLFDVAGAGSIASLMPLAASKATLLPAWQSTTCLPSDLRFRPEQGSAASGPSTVNGGRGVGVDVWQHYGTLPHEALYSGYFAHPLAAAACVRAYTRT
jgi:hypothetical protein